MKKSLLLILLLVSLSVPQRLLAQSSRISGRVQDGDKPLAGVSVAVKGKNNGTVTNSDGVFELKTNLPATLVVSLIGYARQEVEASENLAINLVPAIEELNQVVITASRVEENILRSPVSIEKWTHGPSSRRLRPTTTTGWSI